ncbi:APC family permease [Neobacillus mesonae]|uniref:APC family permease n=1 Tax=Neobacillus mesonae TaxID=1193713 RepID=UPI00203E2286|nr:APC family permease [Neobacillus mesonae]MCM3571188.1 APC family permease [Neobacillus mesonae]
MEYSKKSFNRTLTLVPVTLFGIAYMTPVVVFTTFGVLSEATQGLIVSGYLVTIIAMLFTAYSYSQMIKAFPTAGSAYTYTRKSIGPHLGFMIGWTLLLDYMFLPMAICVLTAYTLSAAIPALPFWAAVLIFIVPPTIINILGIKLAARLNFWLMMFQFLVIAIFIILSIKSLLEGTGSIISLSPLFSSHFSIPVILSGAAIAAYSFLGFDAISTLSEETIEPKKTIPRATLLSVIVCGGIFLVVSYLAQLVHPSFKFEDVNSGGYEVVRMVGGNLFVSIFIAGLVVSSFASAIAAQASAGRLMFVMGRDSVLPQKIFGYLHPKYKTPVFNLIILGAISLLALKLDVATSTSFINFGGFTAFIFVNISVIVHYFFKGNRRSSRDILLFLILPGIGAIFDTWLWTNLDKHALILGGIWTACGFIYLLGLTRMFKKRPPELNFEDLERDVS